MAEQAASVGPRDPSGTGWLGAQSVHGCVPTQSVGTRKNTWLSGIIKDRKVPAPTLKKIREQLATLAEAAGEGNAGLIRI